MLSSIRLCQLDAGNLRYRKPFIGGLQRPRQQLAFFNNADAPKQDKLLFPFQPLDTLWLSSWIG